MQPRKFVAPEFVFGPEALALVGRYAMNMAAKKVFLVTDPGIISAGWTAQAEASLARVGLPYEVFSDVTSNPKDQEVMAGASRYLKAHCNIILAVGGGSPIDCAKGIGIVVSNDRPIQEFEGVDRVQIPGPPLICIPTTAGTSADVSQFAIISSSSRHTKIALISKALVPDVSLVDPVTTTTMSAELTAATGIDAFIHGIEAYVSNASSPMTDINALEAIRLIFTHLENAITAPMDLNYRNPMMLGSLLAGLAFSNASLGLVHAMAHSLGGFNDLSHGLCNAILLEHVVAFNFDSAPERYTRIAQTLGLPETSSAEQKRLLVNTLATFRRKAGFCGTLRDVGVKEADLPALAQNALQDPCIVTNPIDPTLEQIQQIYERAL